MSALHHWQQNHLLGSLAIAHLLPHVELTHMQLGEILYETNCQAAHVYFPTTATVSIHYLLDNGATSQVHDVGNDGLVGISFVLGGNTTPNRAIVLIPGWGYKIKAEIFSEEVKRGGLLLQSLLLYAQAMITETAQLIVCNRHHSVEQQLSYWFLRTIDRLPAPINPQDAIPSELSMTQEMLALIFGVRRERVTEAVNLLQKHGAIRYRRGHITVLDRSGLEECVCECYAVVRHESARLLPNVPRHHMPHVPCSAADKMASMLVRNSKVQPACNEQFAHLRKASQQDAHRYTDRRDRMQNDDLVIQKKQDGQILITLPISNEEVHGVLTKMGLIYDAALGGYPTAIATLTTILPAIQPHSINVKSL